MSIRTNFIVALALVVLAGLCNLVFRWMGSEVGEDGLLHEPFALIPIGYLLFAAGMVFALVAVVRVVMRNMSDD